jgi:hypothetical protein
MSSVDELRPGDWKDVDEYTRELRETGYKADYRNLWSGTNGFTAIVTVEGVEHAIFEGSITGHLVKEVKNPVQQIVQQ